MTDIVSLGLSVDSTSVPKATVELDKFSNSALKAAEAETKLGSASAATGAQLAAAATAVNKNAAATVAATSGAQGGAAAATRAAAAAATGLTEAQRKTAAATMGAAISAGQLSQAYRQLPAQITDVVTSLASGQSAFIVAIQQGGQIKDSFGGIGSAARALFSILTPARLVFGGLAAAAALTAKAFADGQAESFELYKAVTLSGNAAGVTTGQLDLMAGAIDKVVGTHAQASAALAAAVATGKISADSLRDVGEVASRLQQSIGQPIEETIKLFAQLGDKPTESAAKLQKQLNFLTVATYEQIRALESDGRSTEAVALAQSSLFDALNQRAKDLDTHLGVIPRAWHSIAGAAKEAWDAMLGLGREKSPEERLQELLEQRANPPRGRGGTAPARAGAQSILDQQISQAQKDVAAGQAKAAEAAKQAKEFEDAQAKRALQQVATSAAGATAAAQLQANISGIKRTLDSSLDVFENYDQILEAQRSAHLVSETEYYDARRALIQADAQERVKALQSENALLAAESERLRVSAAAQASQATSQADQYKAILAVVPQVTANEEKRKQNLAEIAKIGADAATKTVVLGINQKKATDDIAQGFEDARAAAQAYLDTLQRRQKLELDGLGAGDKQREFNSGRSDIEADYARQRQELDRDLRRKQITKEQYDEELKIVEEFQGKALKAYDGYYDDLNKKQGSYFIGAAEAFHNYVDQAQNSADQVASALTRGLDSATDALVKFVQTGKLDFKGLVDSILADLLRIQLQKSLSNVLSTALGSLFGPGYSLSSGIGSGANLNNAWANSGFQLQPLGSFAVGTNYVPRDGMAMIHKGEAIVPAKFNPAANQGAFGAGGGGGNVSITQQFTFGAGTNPAQLQAAAEQIKAQTKAEIFDDLARGRRLVRTTT